MYKKQNVICPCTSKTIWESIFLQKQIKDTILEYGPFLIIFFWETKIKKVTDWPRSVTRKSGWMETRKFNTSIYFRPNAVVVCSNTDENSECETNVKWKSKSSQNSLLFVYQEPWKKRLLLHYGNELVLLDTTYGTKRYALPLLFLVVKTNIDYQIVGAFVSEND